MDIFLFIAGVLFLVVRKYEYVLSIIILLATTYLQLQITGLTSFLFPHNISDIGLLLYILFFVVISFKYGISTKHPMVKYVNIFFFFLLLSGIYDVLTGASVGDVIRYFRNWFYLSIVYIAPYVKSEWTTKSLKIIYYVTIILCILILFQTFMGINILNLRISEGRGIKPPSYSIYCAALCLINVWNLPLRKRLLHFCILVLPMILNQKMTYVISVFGIYCIYVLFVSNWSISQKLLVGIAFIFISGGLFFAGGKFSDRFLSMTQEIKTVNSNEVSGNFSFRLLHASERLRYVVNDPIYFIRGIGFVAEANYHQDAFSIGLWDESRGRYSQLDTGDIAWSLFFIRLGIVGTLIYLILYFKLVRLYKNNIACTKYSAYFVSMMLVFLFFTSFGNALIAYGDFFIYPILFTNYFLSRS